MTKPEYDPAERAQAAHSRDEGRCYVDYPVHRTRVRKSPYFEATRAAGLAAASVYNHMYMPTGMLPAAEYDRLIRCRHVGVAVERQVALKGPDALAARYRRRALG